jgi:hypothetical protein
MKKIFHQLFSGKDNLTLDLGRILWAMMAVTYMAVTFARSNSPFDYVVWATGAGIILAGGGGALALKAHTEPSPPDA